MDKRTKDKLLQTAYICDHLADGLFIQISKKDLCLIPSFLDVKTKTAAKKQGLVLKHGAKPIGSCSWRLSVGFSTTGDLYLGSSFKRKDQ